MMQENRSSKFKADRNKLEEDSAAAAVSEAFFAR